MSDCNCNNDCQGIQNLAGLNGVGIVSTFQNSDGSITFVYSDGTSFTTVPLSNNGGTGNPLHILPEPMLKIEKIPTDLEWLDFESGLGISGLTLLNTPVINTSNLTNEQVTEGVYLEMIIYRRNRRKKRISFDNTITKKGYIVPPGYVNGQNVLQTYLGATAKLNTRGGIPNYLNDPLEIDRPNHYKITTRGEVYNAGVYLNGRFCKAEVIYQTSDLTDDAVNLTIPVSRRNFYRNHGVKTFAYTPNFTNMYIAFRYIMWDATANNNKGMFITGPTTQRVSVGHTTTPFMNFSSTESGIKICELKPELEDTGNLDIYNARLTCKMNIII